MDSKVTPKGYQQITNVSAAVGLTLPDPLVEFCIFECEAQSVRWRDDGTNPTAAIGMLLPVNTPFEYWGNLSALKFIETAASAKLNVVYYYQ